MKSTSLKNNNLVDGLSESDIRVVAKTVLKKIEDIINDLYHNYNNSISEDIKESDDIVNYDKYHTNLYGGDPEYCYNCGSKLIYDNDIDNFICPECINKEELVGNNISNNLPTTIDNFLQDLAQTYGGINYNDIMIYGKCWNSIPSDMINIISKSIRRIKENCNELGLDIQEAAEVSTEVKYDCERIVDHVKFILDSFNNKDLI